MNLCHSKAVVACHELVEDGKIGPVPGYVPIYPYSCRPEDQIGAMNAEELTQKIWDDLYVFREYSSFVKNYWKVNDIDPDIRPGDMELIAQAKIDFIAVNCYRSDVGMAPMTAISRKSVLINPVSRGNSYILTCQVNMRWPEILT